MPEPISHEPGPDGLLPEPSQAEAIAPKTFVGELNERMTGIEHAQTLFVREALQKGVTPEDLPAAVADAMTAGALPRILPGQKTRGSGFSLLLIDGKVPRSLVPVEVVGEVNSPDFKAKVGHRELPIDYLDDYATEEELEGCSVVETPMLPQWGNQPPNSEILQQIDAHIVPAAETVSHEPGPDVLPPNPSHPEVDSEGEVTETTKDELLTEITNKAEGHTSNPYGTFIELGFDDPAKGRLEVLALTTPNPSGRLAAIDRFPPEGTEESDLRQTYYLLRTPDGNLHLERYSADPAGEAESVIPPSNVADTASALGNIFKGVVREEQSRVLQRELGLPLVMEQEAKDLIADIRTGTPIIDEE